MCARARARVCACALARAYARGIAWNIDEEVLRAMHHSGFARRIFQFQIFIHFDSSFECYGIDRVVTSATSRATWAVAIADRLTHGLVRFEKELINRLNICFYF